jgi:hypothetical protein
MELEWTDLTRRLDRLEQDNRRLKATGAVAVIILAGLLLMGQAGPTKVVEAEKFVVRDAKGTIRAELFGTASGAAELHLADKDGIQRLLTDTGNEPRLLFPIPRCLTFQLGLVDMSARLELVPLAKGICVAARIEDHPVAAVPPTITKVKSVKRPRTPLGYDVVAHICPFT